MQQNTVTPNQPEPSPEEPAEPAPSPTADIPSEPAQKSSPPSRTDKLRQQIWPDDRCFVLSLN